MPDRETTLETTLSVRFLVRAAAVGVVACLVGGAALHGLLARELGPQYRAAHYALKHTLGLVMPALLFCAVSVLFVGAVGLLAVAVLASHKVAGPLFRLQRVAGYLERGILVGRIHLRARDQLQPFAQRLNQWIDTQKHKFYRESQDIERAETGVQHLVDAVASGQKEQVRRVLEELRSFAEKKQNPPS